MANLLISHFVLMILWSSERKKSCALGVRSGSPLKDFGFYLAWKKFQIILTMVIAFRNILIILERNVLIKEALMMVLVQVAMEFAAHVSF